SSRMEQNFHDYLRSMIIVPCVLGPPIHTKVAPMGERVKRNSAQYVENSTSESVVLRKVALHYVRRRFVMKASAAIPEAVKAKEAGSGVPSSKPVSKEAREKLSPSSIVAWISICTAAEWAKTVETS